MPPLSANRKPIDRLDRPLGSLRISVTDRCNLRCNYCMPEETYQWLPRASLLQYEETARLVSCFASLGVSKVRITGGEPLLRRDLDVLIRLVSSDPAVRDLALTTNGVLLADNAQRLCSGGLKRITISLDSLVPQRFKALTRGDQLHRVLEGIDAAREAGFESVKLNTVVMRGINSDEMISILRFAGTKQVEARFIEYMDVGGATGWSPEKVVSRSEILETIAGELGEVTPIEDGDSTAPAERFRLPGGQVFGIISSITSPFCGACDRSRLTADGVWFLCLYSPAGVNLKELLRSGATDEELRGIIAEKWSRRVDRGAEERLELSERASLYNVQSLRDNPHLEMHTRGG